MYLEEVVAISRSAEDLADLPPWEALVQWLHEFVRYAATKRALADEMLTSIDRDAEVFQACRAALTAAGGTLIERAQGGGSRPPGRQLHGRRPPPRRHRRHPGVEPDEVERLLDIVLDGLRYRRAADPPGHGGLDSRP